jgi:hypothetical protein
MKNVIRICAKVVYTSFLPLIAIEVMIKNPRTFACEMKKQRQLMILAFSLRGKK